MIPHTIIQTGKSRNDMNMYSHEWKEKNSNYIYSFFDDEDCREFIRTYFDQDTLQAFDILIPGAFKADLFRYCYLYVFGGVYIDLDCKPIASLSDIVLDGFHFISVSEKDNIPGVYQAFIACVPGIPFLYDAICKIVNNCKIFYYPKLRDDDDWENILSITGPVLLCNCMKNIHDSGVHKIDNLNILLYSLDDNFIVNQYNKEIIQSKVYGLSVSSNSYYELVIEKNIYRKDVFIEKKIEFLRKENVLLKYKRQNKKDSFGFNPSLFVINNQLQVIFRVSDFQMDREKQICSRLIHDESTGFDSDNNESKLVVKNIYTNLMYTVQVPDTRICENYFPYGYEDPRSFKFQNEVWIICSYRGSALGIQCGHHQIIFKLANPSDIKVLKYNDANEIEKNWLPFECNNMLYAVYKISPVHEILNICTETGTCKLEYSTKGHEFESDHVGGGSTPFLKDNVFYCMGHIRTSSFEYRNFIYTFKSSPPFEVLNTSETFSFTGTPVEFGSSIIWHESTWILGCGLDDCHFSYFYVSDVEVQRLVKRRKLPESFCSKKLNVRSAAVSARTSSAAAVSARTSAAQCASTWTGATCAWRKFNNILLLTIIFTIILIILTISKYCKKVSFGQSF